MALEIPKWDVKIERRVLVSVDLIIDRLTMESEAFLVREGYGVQQGWPLGHLMISWQLVCQVVVPQILDSFFKHYVSLWDSTFSWSSFPWNECVIYVLIRDYLLIIIGHLFFTKVVLVLLEPTLLWDFLLWVLRCESHSKLMQNWLRRRPAVMLILWALTNRKHSTCGSIMLIKRMWPTVVSFAMTNAQSPKKYIQLYLTVQLWGYV